MLRRRMQQTSYSGHQPWKQPSSNSNKFASDVVLTSPNEECPFMLQTDASGIGIAGILSQAMTVEKIDQSPTSVESWHPFSSDLNTEWKKYHQLLKQPNELKELLTNDMLIALFPNLHNLATVCLFIPISTASAERSFSDMKLKNRVCRRLPELSRPTEYKFSLNLPKNSLIVI